MFISNVLNVTKFRRKILYTKDLINAFLYYKAELKGLFACRHPTDCIPRSLTIQQFTRQKSIKFSLILAYSNQPHN